MQHGIIEGQVSFGPTAPIARPGTRNYRPMVAWITVFTTDGKIAARSKPLPTERFVSKFRRAIIRFTRNRAIG